MTASSVNGTEKAVYGDGISKLSSVSDADSVPDARPENELFYAKTREDVFITIHFDNPDNCKIMSFMLNGVPYADYMFEYGSDMENIIIKVNVGDKAGVIDYTIDAIQYADRDELKYVVMAGDPTLSISVSPADLPCADISGEVIGPNHVEFDISIVDSYGIINETGGSAKVFLYRGDAVVASQDIVNNAANHVRFEGLIQSVEYRYEVVCTYNGFDELGFANRTVLEKNFTTEKAVKITNVVATYNSVTFDILWNEGFLYEKKLASLALFRNNEKVIDLPEKLTLVEGLMSDTEYTLVATYLINGIPTTEYYAFKTKATAIPSIVIIATGRSVSELSFNVILNDPSNTVSQKNAELLIGDRVIASTDKFGEVSFFGLQGNTQYTLKVSATYDLGDGTGERKLTEYVRSAVTSSDTLAAEIVIEGEDSPIYVGKSEFVSLFSISAENNITASEKLIGKNFTVNILTDLELGDAQCGFWASPGQTVIINGNPYSNSVNFKITGNNNINPTLRAYSTVNGLPNEAELGERGTVIFKNLDYIKEENQAFQYYGGVAVEIIGCNWSSSDKLISPTNAGTVTVRNSILSSDCAVIDFTWSVRNGHINIINLEAGAVLKGQFAVNSPSAQPNNTPAVIEVNVNGATIRGDIFAKSGTVNLNSGDMIGDIKTEGGTVNVSESFRFLEPVATVNGKGYDNLEEAFLVASVAEGDTVLKVLKDGVITVSGTKFNTGGNLTIDGDLGNGNRAVVTFAQNSVSLRWATPEKTLTLQNLVVDAESISTFMQHGYGGASNNVIIKNCKMTVKTKWAFLVCLSNDGLVSNFTVEDSDITVTAIADIGEGNIYRTGNAKTNAFHSIVTFINSKITSMGIINVTQSSTADVIIYSSELTATSNVAFALSNPQDLHANAVCKETTVYADSNSVIYIPHDKELAKYDEECEDIALDIEAIVIKKDF